MEKIVKFNIRGKIWVLEKVTNPTPEDKYMVFDKTTLDIFIHCAKLELVGPWTGNGNWLYLKYSDGCSASMWIDNLTDYINLREFIDEEE